MLDLFTSTPYLIISLLTTCLILCCYKFKFYLVSTLKSDQACPDLQQTLGAPRASLTHQTRSKSKKLMRYTYQSHPQKRRGFVEPAQSQEIPPEPSMTRQPYEVFLVLDIEGTCDQGTNFNYPNEIIVCVVQFPQCYEINMSTSF
jgi:hypothetical protein